MIIPTSGRLVLQKIKQEDDTEKKGVLILPSMQPKQDRYKVINRCHCISHDYVDVHPQVGDVVYIDKYKGVEVVKDGETYLIIEDQDIIAYEA